MIYNFCSFLSGFLHILHFQTTKNAVPGLDRLIKSEIFPNSELYRFPERPVYPSIVCLNVSPHFYITSFPFFQVFQRDVRLFRRDLFRWFEFFIVSVTAGTRIRPLSSRLLVLRSFSLFGKASLSLEFLKSFSGPFPCNTRPPDRYPDGRSRFEASDNFQRFSYQTYTVCHWAQTFFFGV